MNNERRKKLAMDAHMEGQEVIVANIGEPVSVSQMELICLVNFAEIGLMSIFAALDGAHGEEAEESLNQHIERLREVFGKNGNRDGLDRLSQSAAALLRGGKFSKYIC